ncbi:hypothetical protein U1Q18_003212 [Sarracenia purpurea var. burkii]
MHSGFLSSLGSEWRHGLTLMTMRLVVFGFSALVHISVRGGKANYGFSSYLEHWGPKALWREVGGAAAFGYGPAFLASRYGGSRWSAVRSHKATSGPPLGFWKLSGFLSARGSFLAGFFSVVLLVFLGWFVARQRSFSLFSLFFLVGTGVEGCSFLLQGGWLVFGTAESPFSQPLSSAAATRVGSSIASARRSSRAIRRTPSPSIALSLPVAPRRHCATPPHCLRIGCEVSAKILLGSDVEKTFDDNLNDGLTMFCLGDDEFKNFLPKYKNLMT